MLMRITRWSLLLGALSILAGALGGGAVWVVARELPDVRRLEVEPASRSTRILDRHGGLLGEVFVERRTPVSLSRISPLLVQAILAAEDSDFLDHPGLDPLGILRAALHNLRRRRVVEGGSTITQQLAKLLYLTPERNLRRKIPEALLAIQLEAAYSKERILEIYLNHIYLGAGAYGVEAASRTYFALPAAELDLPQAALLAGLAQAPSRYDPFRSPHRALSRRAAVLLRMLREGMISDADYQAALDSPLGLIEPEPPGPAAHFVEWIRIDLERRLGSQRLLSGGLTVWTSLDRSAQLSAERAVADGRSALIERWPDRPAPEAALMALEHGTGRILAMVGGSDFGQVRFNLATQARRRPGSLFKTLLFSAALDAGFTQASLLQDEPITYGDWTPRNYDRRYRGALTLRESLERSVNTVAVQTLHQIGLDALEERAADLGITGELPRNLTAALGTHPITLLEAVQAHGAMAAGGLLWPTYALDRIQAPGGEDLTPPRPLPREAMSPATAAIMTDLLRGVVRSGTGRSAAKLGRAIGGKTGTSDDFMDAWFVGFDRRITAGVWVGRLEEESLGSGETGSRAALPIWREFMAEVSRPADRLPEAPPEFVESVLICRRSGLRASFGCERTFPGLFLPGTAPVQACPLSGQLPEPGIQGGSLP